MVIINNFFEKNLELKNYKLIVNKNTKQIFNKGRKEKIMCQVTVTVELNGKKYQTNVIAHKGMPEDAIKYLAEKQVLNQWSE